MSAEKPMSGEDKPTEMELRVATAMFDAEPAGWGGRCIPEDYISLARVAILAMKLDTQDNPIMDAFNCARFKEWNDAIDAATTPIQESATAAVPLK